MHAPDWARDRTRLSIAGAATAAAVCLLMMFHIDGAKASSAFLSPCPTAATLSEAAGIKISFDKGYGKGNTTCLYTYGSSSALIIDEVGFGGGSSRFVQELRSEAAKAKTSLKLISRLGNAAGEFTVKGNTSLQVLMGRQVIRFDGTLPAKEVLAIAKKVI